MRLFNFFFALKLQPNKSIVKVMIEIKKYKSFAKIQLQNRWTVPVLMTLIIGAILRLFSLPSDIHMLKELSSGAFNQADNLNLSQLLNLITQSSSGKSTFIDFILSLIELSVQFILTYGAIYVYIAMSRSPEQVPFSTFFEGLSNWSRGLLTGLYLLLRIFLWGLIAIPAVTVCVTLVTIINQNSSSEYAVAIVPIVLLLGMIPAFIKAFAYSQTYYLAVEYQNLPITEALKLSIKLTDGHKMDIFLVWLSFIGWFLLGTITFGIANLWITPYVRMTMTNVYHALLKEALENEKINPEDLKQECKENQEMD